MERLAALVPAQCFNMIRYRGVPAPSASWRGFIIPQEWKKLMPKIQCDASKK